MRNRRKRAFQRLQEELPIDPLEGMANLFDAGLVFALALMVALFQYFHLPELLTEKDLVILKNPGKENMEILRKKGHKLEKYKISREKLGGEGVKLGICYRLKNGEVVYVPENRKE
ncbi:MAG: DUF2149 domain-containing protein [Planctomycetota bacterium]|nr:MAG: DUF2149 domain-containing protein [Planctomycetota bacterium]